HAVEITRAVSRQRTSCDAHCVVKMRWGHAPRSRRTRRLVCHREAFAVVKIPKALLQAYPVDKSRRPNRNPRGYEQQPRVEAGCAARKRGHLKILNFRIRRAMRDYEIQVRTFNLPQYGTSDTFTIGRR